MHTVQGLVKSIIKSTFVLDMYSRIIMYIVHFLKFMYKSWSSTLFVQDMYGLLVADGAENKSQDMLTSGAFKEMDKVMFWFKI